MENFRHRSFLILFLIVWGGLIIWNSLTPAQEFSESENRYLKTLPKFSVSSVLKGKFMEDMNTYMSDHFAGRPYWVALQSMIEYGIGKREVNNVYLGKSDGYMLAINTGGFTVPDAKAALTGDVDKPDMGLTAKNVMGINAFAERYELPTYVMIVPSSTEIQKQNLPKFAAGWDEQGYINDVYAGFSSGVTAVDVYSALREREYEYIYYLTDHHWTGHGAYLAYNELARAMGMPESQPADFEIKDISLDFLGTFHSKTGFPLAAFDIIRVFQRGAVKSYEIFDGRETTVRDSIYFDEFLVKKDKYSYFLGQVQPVVTIKTESKSDKKLLIFKDSYAHSLVPMMLDDFSEIRLVDLRFANPMTINEQMEAQNYDEALFLYSTDVFSHQLGTANLAIDN